MNLLTIDSAQIATPPSAKVNTELPQELWRPVKIPGRPELSDLYSVSNNGNVRSERVRNRWSSGQILAKTIREGYILTSLCFSGKRKKYSTHRLVAQAFIPNPDAKKEVNHRNGIKHDNSADNLEWATPSENLKHAYDKLGHKGLPGENNPNVKLTESQVSDIRRLREETGATYRSIGEIYGVSDVMISAIVRRLSWKHV